MQFSFTVSNNIWPNTSKQQLFAGWCTSPQCVWHVWVCVCVCLYQNEKKRLRFYCLYVLNMFLWDIFIVNLIVLELFSYDHQFLGVSNVLKWIYAVGVIISLLFLGFYYIFFFFCRSRGVTWPPHSYGRTMVVISISLHVFRNGKKKSVGTILIYSFKNIRTK